jgi:hypothetical protein
MKLELYQEPRKFHLNQCDTTITDYGKFSLEADEMVSFKTASGRECDFVAKEWGFYPLSSPNSRMKREGFKVALVKDYDGKIQINVIEKDKLDKFEAYLNSHSIVPRIVCWLDEIAPDQLDDIEVALTEKVNDES